MKRHRLALAAAWFICALATIPAGADKFGPVLEFPRWIPLGPSLIENGQAKDGTVAVTGRINVVAPNPQNPLGDIWIGSASGGVWHGSVAPDTGWTPMTDQAPSLATGAIALDSCDATRCATVWVGTGENSIRRDTQYGRGILKGTWNGRGYDWALLGAAQFSLGSITKIVLDPSTPDGPGKVLYVALSSGQTSNGTHSTVTTEPAGPYGIWKSVDGGQSFFNVLDMGVPATDLEMDPLNPQVLFAGLRHKGIYRSTNGGAHWDPIHNGISPTFLESGADWPEIAVYRKPKMPEPLLYAVIGPCPHPHEKGDVYYCSPAVYRSTTGGSSWSLVHAWDSLPDKTQPLTSYTSYTHALTIHPEDPDVLWYGGTGLYRSENGGVDWQNVGDQGLHPDHHQVVVFPFGLSSTGVLAYDVNDGGFAVGNGEDKWIDTLQQGLAVTQFLSVSASPLVDFIIAGAQDNGTNLQKGTDDVWSHLDHGDAASTQMDLDDGKILYDVAPGVDPERCAKADLCPEGWPDIHTGLPPVDSPDTSWYPPLVQDPTEQSGQHPLYFATNHLFHSLSDGDPWTAITSGTPLGGTDTFAELNGSKNPITAVAVAPSEPKRVYLGYYGGQIFTTKDIQAMTPVWKRIDDATLPDRPVTSIAVDPENPELALVSFSGFGQHSVYRTGQAGASWVPLDASADGVFAEEPVNTLLIEPGSPHRVWAGTDYGVWVRSGSDPGIEVWTKSEGLPNVAVYDLDLSGDGETLLAATHGRGVWMRARRIRSDFYYELCCGPIDLYDPAPFLSVAALGFDPRERCSMTLLEGERECATSELDADGAALETDEQGFLVTTKAGYYTQRRLGWACYGGACAGGVSLDRCNVSEVRITCGEHSVQTAVQRPREKEDPPSTRLGFLPAGQEGSFTVAALLKRNDGGSRVLCEQAVTYSSRETAEQVLGRAAEALNRDERCRNAGVEAVLAGSSRPGEREDEGPVPFLLQLAAPRETGVQLVTELTSAGAGAFTVGSFGDAESRVVPRLYLAGRATGGRVTVTETSSLGPCTFAVDTEEGGAAETVAVRIQDVFLAREASSTFRLEERCAARQNPRDAERSGAILRFPLGRQVTVTSTDRGLSFTLGSDR